MTSERDDEELKTLYLSINLEETEVKIGKKRKGHRMENQYHRRLKYLNKKIKYRRVNIERFGIISFTEYYTFEVKAKQPSFFSSYVHTLLFPTTQKPLLNVITFSFFPTQLYLWMGSSFNDFLISPSQLDLSFLDGSSKQQKVLEQRATIPVHLNSSLKTPGDL